MRYVLSCVLLLPLAASAQDKKDTKPGDEMIYKYLCAETDKLSQKFLDGAKTLDEWQTKRPRLYQEYMDMLGLWPIPEKTPLKATKTGEIEAYGVVVEKIHFQSKPGLYVTANLYRPKDAASAKRKQYPAILYVCGHSNRGRDGNKSAFQDHGFWFANNGYVCLVVDSLQLGEIPAVHHGTYGRPWISIQKYKDSNPDAVYPKDVPENRWWWHSLGYSPAAVECWNGIRAIDYLQARPDVDPDKIGVTGISGGGAATFWIAAADPRVKVAVPVSGMADLESYIKNKVINGHCDCMFLYNTYQWDWTTIAALIAPRPLLFANSDKDPIFPMDANRRVMKKLQTIYDMYGKPGGESSNPRDLVQEYISSGGHDYRPDLRVAIFQFLNKHLKGDAKSKVEDSAQYTPLEGKKLRVFATDADLPKDAINHRIDELFIPAAKVVLPEKGKFAEWKKDMITKVREKSFRPFPERIPAAKSVRVVTFTTEPEIRAALAPGRPGKSTGRTVLFTHDDLDYIDEQKRVTLEKMVENLTGDGMHLTMGLRGETGLPWTQKSPPNYVDRSHLLLGRTVEQGRVRDIAAFARFNEIESEWRIVVGYGRHGILAAYAALFEPSIKEVVVIDPPKSHKEGPHFLNVLRVLDIPEALGLLAPTPLTIIGGKDRAFDRTEEIYRLAGAADKLTRK